MGLDIHLSSKAEKEADDAYEEASELWYEEWGDKPDSEEKAAARTALPPSGSSANPASERYPDHLFNRRYLRSSYNGGGFNRAVPDMVGEDHSLYWIFEPVIGNDEPYSTELTISHIQLLEDVKKRALQVAQEIKDSDPLRTMSVMAHLGSAEHMWHQLPSEGEALAWYREEQARHEEAMAQRRAEGKDDTDFFSGGYSNAKGEVLGFTKGLEILAVTLGRNPLAGFSALFPADTVGGQIGVLPEPILIYRMDEEAKDSYVQSAEITAEFCDEAIALIRADGSCFMHWSG